MATVNFSFSNIVEFLRNSFINSIAPILKIVGAASTVAEIMNLIIIAVSLQQMTYTAAVSRYGMLGIIEVVMTYAYMETFTSMVNERKKDDGIIDWMDLASILSACFVLFIMGLISTGVIHFAYLEALERVEIIYNSTGGLAAIFPILGTDFITDCYQFQNIPIACEDRERLSYSATVLIYCTPVFNIMLTAIVLLKLYREGKVVLYSPHTRQFRKDKASYAKKKLKLSADLARFRLQKEYEKLEKEVLTEMGIDPNSKSSSKSKDKPKHEYKDKKDEKDNSKKHEYKANGINTKALIDEIPFMSRYISKLYKQGQASKTGADFDKDFEAFCYKFCGINPVTSEEEIYDNVTKPEVKSFIEWEKAGSKGSPPSNSQKPVDAFIEFSKDLMGEREDNPSDPNARFNMMVHGMHFHQEAKDRHFVKIESLLKGLKGLDTRESDPDSFSNTTKSLLNEMNKTHALGKPMSGMINSLKSHVNKIDTSNRASANKIIDQVTSVMKDFKEASTKLEKEAKEVYEFLEGLNFLNVI